MKVTKSDMYIYPFSIRAENDEEFKQIIKFQNILHSRGSTVHGWKKEWIEELKKRIKTGE